MVKARWFVTVADRSGLVALDEVAKLDPNFRVEMELLPRPMWEARCCAPSTYVGASAPAWVVEIWTQLSRKELLKLSVVRRVRATFTEETRKRLLQKRAFIHQVC